MSINDKEIATQGTDVYPGVANPTKSNNPGNPMAENFVNDPTTEETGAGAGADFRGGRDAKRAMRRLSGVVEARPGIIEDTHIDPLSETSNDDDGWVNATVTPGQSKAPETAGAVSSTLESAGNITKGAAEMAYGKVTGSAMHEEQGRKALYGKTE